MYIEHGAFYRVTHSNTTDETVKTTQKLKNIPIWSLFFGCCIQLNSLMVYKMIKHRNKTVLAYKAPWIQENGLNQFRTNVSEVSFFVDNPVHEH